MHKFWTTSCPKIRQLCIGPPVAATIHIVPRSQRSDLRRPGRGDGGFVAAVPGFGDDVAVGLRGN